MRFVWLKETAKFTIFETADKIMLHKTLIRPTLMYGSESWPLSKKDENLLQIFERRILRRICSPINESGIWRIRYGSELRKPYNEPDSQSDQNRKTEVAGTPLQNATAGPLQTVNITQTRGHSTCRKTQGKVAAVS
jgi:hypothetical protein